MRGPGPFLKAATLVLLVAIWGTTWAAVRISLVGFAPFTGITLRFVVAALLLVGFARLVGIPLAPVNANDRKLRILHAVLTFCVSYGVVFWSEQWVPSGLASVLFATFPLIVAVIAHFALPEECMTAQAALGTVLGFVAIFLGVVFLDEPLTLRFIVGSALVVIGVATASRKNWKDRPRPGAHQLGKL